MKEFYHINNKNKNLNLPYIVGMTASPTQISKSSMKFDKLHEKLKHL